jgi:hypothetical protein
MSESLQPFELQIEALAEQLDLKAQWEQRVKALYDTHVLEILPQSRRLGFVDIDGHECPLPSYDEIKKMITPEKAELLEKKSGQGFVRLQMTPLTMPLDTLVEKYKATLLQRHKDGRLMSTKGDQLDLDESNPLYVWDQYQGADTKDTPEEGVVYYPEQYERANHGGKTKKDLVKEGQSWEIELIENMPDLKAKGAGDELGDRRQFEADSTPRTYLETLQTDPGHTGEQGFTAEDWLTYAISSLEEEDIQIDDWSGQGKACYNLGSYFPAGSLVSYCRFHRGYRPAFLSRDDPDYHPSNLSARSSVKINP